MQLVHESSGNSFIGDTGSGTFGIVSSGVGVFIQKHPVGVAETLAKFLNDGAVELYYNNVKKFETTQDGVTITGDTDIIGDLDLTGSPSNKGRISANYLDVPNISPVGSIMIWPGATNTWPTANWRECNGASGFSQANHPDLWAVIGNTYGGNSSNFNLPDLRGQFVTGIGVDTWNNTLAGTGGRSDAILPQHIHDIDDPGHSHDFTAAIQNGAVEQNDGAIRCVNANLTTNDSTTGITIDNVDGTDTNASIINDSGQLNVANLPPYRALYYIIRIK